jgi:integral membrane protein
MMFPEQRNEELAQLRRMRVISLIEGSTLLLLVLAAVPLKHLAGLPLATRIMGPIHGLAFLTYIWMLIQLVSGGGWSRPEITRLVIAAFIPFGGFVNARVLARREGLLAAP